MFICHIFFNGFSLGPELSHVHPQLISQEFLRKMQTADAGLFRFTCSCGFKGFYDREINVFIEKVFSSKYCLHTFVDKNKLRQIIKLTCDLKRVAASLMLKQFMSFRSALILSA